MILDEDALAAESAELETLGRTFEKLSRLAEVEARYDELRAEVDRLSDTLDAPALPEAPGRPPRPFPFPRHPAWLGMSISCDGCSIKAPKSGGELEWRFDNSPKVRGLDPEDSPVRFLETFGGAKVEVRGEDSVRVTRDESSGEILIRTRDAFVRIRLPEKKN